MAGLYRRYDARDVSGVSLSRVCSPANGAALVAWVGQCYPRDGMLRKPAPRLSIAPLPGSSDGAELGLLLPACAAQTGGRFLPT
jgi:hypothetical protein